MASKDTLVGTSVTWDGVNIDDDPHFKVIAEVQAESGLFLTLAHVNDSHESHTWTVEFEDTSPCICS